MFFPLHYIKSDCLHSLSLFFSLALFLRHSYSFLSIACSQIAYLTASLQSSSFEIIHSIKFWVFCILDIWLSYTALSIIHKKVYIYMREAKFLKQKYFVERSYRYTQFKAGYLNTKFITLVNAHLKFIGVVEFVELM